MKRIPILGWVVIGVGIIVALSIAGNASENDVQGNEFPDQFAC